MVWIVFLVGIQCDKGRCFLKDVQTFPQRRRQPISQRGIYGLEAHARSTRWANINQLLWTSVKATEPAKLQVGAIMDSLWRVVGPP